MIQQLDWDSQFFKKRIGALLVGDSSLNMTTWNQAIQEARQLQLDCLYIRLPAQDLASIDFCKKHDAIFTLNQVTLEKELSQIPTDTTGITDNLSMADFPGLGQLCEELSAKSRFNFDPRFGAHESKRLFQHWLDQSINPKPMQKGWLAKDGNEIAGYCTVRFRDQLPFIDLFVVASAHQGKGFSQRLLSAAALWSKQQGAQKLRVVTQEFNKSALGAFEKFGFAPIRTEAIFHLWFS